MQEQDNIPIMVAIRCITYNQEPYIRQCLEGFVMQKTNFRFVAIVHDDASTDGTQAIIREYEEKYPDTIKPIYETENQYSKRDGSLTRIMDEACDATGCKYIALCEGDDYWTDPLKLQTQIDYLEDNTNCSLIYTNASIVNESSKVIKKSLNIVSVKNMTNYFMTIGNPIVTATTCYRREYLKEYNLICSSIPFKLFMGDLPLWIFLSIKGEIHYLSINTTSYRLLSDSASHSKSRERTVDFYNNTCKILLYFNERFHLNIPSSIIKKNVCVRLIKRMSNFNKRDFHKVYIDAIKMYPSLIINIKLVVIYMSKILFNMKW